LGYTGVSVVNVLNELDEKVASGIKLFQSWTESKMAYSGQPGLSAAIIHGQNVIWSRGFGFSDIEKNREATVDTIFRIASITKLFTSTAILQLRDKDKLRLDDSVKDWLPWFSIKNKKGKHPITIRNLITHTSGLPREAYGPYWTTSDFPTEEEVIKNLPQQIHILAPWRKWKYSNLALSLAGMIVAEAAGSSYEDYIKNNILNPLEMSDTYVNISTDHPQLATGYGRRLPDGTRSKVPFTESKGITPAANMATTVIDLAKFAMLQFIEDEDNIVLNGETLREMHRVQWLDSNWELGWGLGFNILRLRNKTYVGHGGSVRGYRTNLRINLEDKIAIIIFTNSDDGNPDQYVGKALEWIQAPLIKTIEEKKPLPVEYSQYIGKYRNVWTDIEVIYYNNFLFLINPIEEDPLKEATKLIPISKNTFKMDDPGYGSHGELAVFEIDETGKVTRLMTGENYSFPIENW
jgi:CubicO group peptidase (beta-lactamase class C family)